MESYLQHRQQPKLFPCLIVAFFVLKTKINFKILSWTIKKDFVHLTTTSLLSLHTKLCTHGKTPFPKAELLSSGFSLAQSKTLQNETRRNPKWGISGKTEPGFGAVPQIHAGLGTRWGSCYKPNQLEHSIPQEPKGVGSPKAASKHIPVCLPGFYWKSAAPSPWRNGKTLK